MTLAGRDVSGFVWPGTELYKTVPDELAKGNTRSPVTVPTQSYVDDNTYYGIILTLYYSNKSVEYLLKGSETAQLQKVLLNTMDSLSTRRKDLFQKGIEQQGPLV